MTGIFLTILLEVHHSLIRVLVLTMHLKKIAANNSEVASAYLPDAFHLPGMPMHTTSPDLITVMSIFGRKAPLH